MLCARFFKMSRRALGLGCAAREVQTLISALPAQKIISQLKSWRAHLVHIPTSRAKPGASPASKAPVRASGLVRAFTACAPTRHAHFARSEPLAR